MGHIMSILKPSYYTLDELIRNWKSKYKEDEITQNTIFNLAYNNHLTLYAKKISWLYRIWASRENYIDDKIEFSSDYPTLYLVETGYFSLYDVEITTFEESYVTDSDAVDDIYFDNFDNEITPTQIPKERTQAVKTELINSGKELNHIITNDEFLTCHISDFERYRDNHKIKGFYGVEPTTLTPPYETIDISNLDSYDLDAKDYIAQQFNDPIYEYMHTERSITMKQLKQDDYKVNSRWTQREKEEGFNCIIEKPSAQVQIDYTTKINEDDIYLLRVDKENAESFLDNLSLGKTLNVNYKKNALSDKDKERQVVLDKVVLFFQSELKKAGLSLTEKKDGRLFIPLTGGELFKILCEWSEKLFKGIKKGKTDSVSTKTFWRKCHKYSIISGNDKYIKEENSEIRKIILSK